MREARLEAALLALMLVASASAGAQTDAGALAGVRAGGIGSGVKAGGIGSGVQAGGIGSDVRAGGTGSNGVKAGSATSPGPRFGLGHTATPAQIASWNIDIAPDGIGLPPGRGTVAEGRALYAQQCAACHGPQGEGGLGDPLVGGQGTLASTKPLRTVGSYWPYATTLFDYIRRAMPINAPQSLTPQQVYAVSGYLLHLNQLLPAEATIDAQVLTRVRMPNRDGFVADPRPDVPPDSVKAAR